MDETISNFIGVLMQFCFLSASKKKKITILHEIHYYTCTKQDTLTEHKARHTHGMAHEIQHKIRDQRGLVVSLTKAPIDR